MQDMAGRLGRASSAALHAALIVAGLGAAAAAERSESGGLLQVPGDDIFGFTSPTDVGVLGDAALAAENDGFFGTRHGRYRAVTQKLEYAYTLPSGWSAAFATYGAWTSLRRSPDFRDRQAYGLEGTSFEVRHRVVERTSENRLAVTLAMEPHWSRLDTFSGLRSHSFYITAKLQADAPISRRLFWGMNANLGSGVSRAAADHAATASSDSSVSAALAYAAVEDEVWLGAEVRWHQAWHGSLFARLDGQALFVGPTIAWKATSSLTLSAVFSPQVFGKARGAAGPVDLDHFESASARLKASLSF